nr:hypothetical protein [Tanacetum cinerariifolium]
MYTPQFSESFREEYSPVEEIKEIQVPVMQKKPGRRRQMTPKKKPQKEKTADQRYIPWTLEEETALCKGWVHISEDSVKGDMRKERGFWIEILKYMHETCPITQRRTYDMEDENEVEEVRRRKPMGRDQAKRKMKAGLESSASSFDVEVLAKMMASEYVITSDPYNVQKNQEMSELLKIKKQKLELKAAELEIRRMENRQRDKALYETMTDEALKERLRKRLFG